MSKTEESMRSKLIGTWELIEYIAYSPADPNDRIHLLGENAKGIIVYTADGYMSAQLLNPGQKSFGELQGAENKESEWAELGRRYHAYTGPFYLTEKDSVTGKPRLWHSMAVSIWPVFLGDTQVRTVEIEDREDGRYLILGTEAAVKLTGGKDRVPRVVWRRLTPNLATSPPSI